MGAEWVETEMKGLHLRDARLTDRAKQLIATFSAQPAKSIPEACGNWAATSAAYDFFGNQRVEANQIRAAHAQATVERAAGEQRVLALQDSTDLNYSGKKVAEELGPLSNQHSRGLRMHSVLLASAQGVPLGLVYQYPWSRDPATQGKAKARRNKETEAKESQRWLDALRATEAQVAEESEIVHVADREGDIYALLAVQRQARSQLLIRMTHNRRVEHPQRYVWDAMRQAPILGETTVEVTEQANREARLAQIWVRFSTLTVRPAHQKAGPGVTLQFLLAEEHDCPVGAEPIVWLLATTLPVDSLADALTCIGYYALRWLIERYHFVLKSGCLIEELYLHTPDRLLRAVAIYAIVAWRVLWLTYSARQSPDLPCTGVFQTHEWQALYCKIHKTALPPENPPSLAQAILWIARLGGFLARKRDGFPGPKTIWRGLRRLDDIAETWLLFHPSSFPNPSLTENCG
jgi:hypothetical protein